MKNLKNVLLITFATVAVSATAMAEDFDPPSVNVGLVQNFNANNYTATQFNTDNSVSAANAVNVQNPSAVTVQRFNSDGTVRMIQENTRDSVEALNYMKNTGANGLTWQTVKANEVIMEQRGSENSTQAGNYYTDH